MEAIHDQAQFDKNQKSGNQVPTRQNNIITWYRRIAVEPIITEIVFLDVSSPGDAKHLGLQPAWPMCVDRFMPLLINLMQHYLKASLSNHKVSL